MSEETTAADPQDRIRELESQISELQRGLAELSALVAAPLPAPGRATALSRRRLLTSVPAVVAAGLAASSAGGLLGAAPAAAAEGDPVLAGATTDAGSATTTLTSTADSVLAVNGGNGEVDIAPGQVLIQQFTATEPVLGARFADGRSSADLVVSGEVGAVAFLTVDGTRTRGQGLRGAPAVAARSTGSAAVLARGAGGREVDDVGNDVEVVATAVDAAVDGTGTAVLAAAEAGTALRASSSAPGTRTDAVVVTTAGLGRGILATSTNRANDVGVVTGVSQGTGAALWGTAANPDSTFAAVVGFGSAKGRGGRFRGGAGALTLVPAKAATHPASGEAGDVFVDSSVRLWFCRGGATWVRLA